MLRLRLEFGTAFALPSINLIASPPVFSDAASRLYRHNGPTLTRSAIVF
jgi:hypothetical protein